MAKNSLIWKDSINSQHIKLQPHSNKYMAITVKLFHRFFQLILLLLLLISILMLSGAAILFFKQEYIINTLKESMNRYPDLSFTYASVSVNTIKTFPRFSYSFTDFSLAINSNLQSDTIFKTDDFQVNIALFKLLRGKIDIKNITASNAVIKWRSNYSEDLFDGSNENQGSVSVLISGISFKNFNIELLDSSSNRFLICSGDKLNIKFKAEQTKMLLSIQSELSKVILGENFKITNPHRVNFDIKKNDNILYIYNIESSIKSLRINGYGYYDLSSEIAAFRFKLNHFEAQDLSFMPNIESFDQIKGIITANAYLRLSSGFEKFDTLQVRYNSDRLKWLTNNEVITINNMEGYTLLTDNFSKHISYIPKASIETNNVKISVNAKVKGLKNYIILAKGFVSHVLKIQNPEIAIETNGQFKALLSYAPKTETITPLLLKSYLVFENKNGFSLNQLTAKGTIEIGNDLKIDGYLKSSSTDVNFNISQASFLESFAQKKYSPIIHLHGNHINYNDIVQLIANTPKDSASNSITIPKFSFTLNFKGATFNRLKLNNLKANGILKGDTISTDYFTADCFDGNVSGRFKSYSNSVHTNLWVSNVSIENVFKNFENWGQSYITADNLSGRFKGIMNIQFKRNEKGEVEMGSLKLFSDVQVVQGKLKGMDKIKKLSKWLNLDQVKVIAFDTLKNKITIENRKIIIPNMDIKSNVLLMNVSGVHDFDNRYEYIARINISNLLKRKFVKSDQIDFHSSTDGSINLYLKLFGQNDSYKVEWINKKGFESGIQNTVQTDSISIQNSPQIKPKVKTDGDAGVGYMLEWDEQIDTLKNY